MIGTLADRCADKQDLLTNGSVPRPWRPMEAPPSLLAVVACIQVFQGRSEGALRCTPYRISGKALAFSSFRLCLQSGKNRSRSFQKRGPWLLNVK